MAETKGYSSGFRMKQLPKAEYYLMKALITKHSLDDPTEAFVIALRLWYEVMYSNEGQGKQWVMNVIDTWRSNKGEVREYEV